MAKTMKKKTAKAGGMNGKSSKPKKNAAAQKVRTKSELFGTIAEQTELTKKQVASVFDVMAQILQADLNKGGPGVVNVAGLMKVTVTRKPATKEREGINPFTGEKTIFKAKPARNVVKIRPLKTLKAMV